MASNHTAAKSMCRGESGSILESAKICEQYYILVIKKNRQSILEMIESSKSMPSSNCKELWTLVKISSTCVKVSFEHKQFVIPWGQFSAWLLNFDPNQMHINLYQSFSGWASHKSLFKLRRNWHVTYQFREYNMIQYLLNTLYFTILCIYYEIITISLVNI